MSAAIAGLAVAAVGTAYSISQSRKASKAAKSANEAQRSINKLKNKQAKRQFMRQFRQAQAAAIQGAIASGVGIESSAFQGTLSSQGTQAKLAETEFAKMDELGGVQTAAMNAQSSAQFKAQTWGSVASLASQFVSFDFNKGASGGGIQEIDTSSFNIRHPKRF